MIWHLRNLHRDLTRHRLQRGTLRFRRPHSEFRHELFGLGRPGAADPQDVDEGDRMSLRTGITVELMNERGKGRLPGLFGFRVIAIEG